MTPQAQQIVDRFKPFVSDAGITYAEMLETERVCCIKCAIVAVEMVITHAEDTTVWANYIQMLTELKNELK